MVSTVAVFQHADHSAYLSLATLGARMAIGAHDSKSVACIILAGDEFPAAVLEQFGTWDMSLVVRNVHNASSTRGLLKYLDADFGRKNIQFHSLEDTQSLK